MNNKNIQSFNTCFLPYGEPTAGSSRTPIKYTISEQTFVEQRSNWGTNYKFNGKELDDELRSNSEYLMKLEYNNEQTGFYYYGARYYTPDLSIWLSIDPLSDKYPSMSPYMYCLGNPIVFIDPDGRQVKISGEAKKAYYQEVKKGASALGISVKMNRDGILTAKHKGKGDICKDGQLFMSAVNDRTTMVNMDATNSNYVNGVPFVGGAFMGNSISFSLNGDGTLSPGFADAFQTVNPGDLKQIDDYYGKPGQTSIHEITEAYQGVQISFSEGYSSGDANADGSVYKRAHDAATPQSGNVYENRYDAQDNWLPRKDWDKAKWIDFNVGNPPNDKNIRTIKID